MKYVSRILSFIRQIDRFIQTIRHLKFRQFLYILKARIGLNLFKTRLDLKELKNLNSFYFLQFENKISLNKRELILLNQKVLFKHNIDWNYNKNGDLWNYNLNYLDFLNTRSLDDKLAMHYLESFLNNYSAIKSGKDPYPTSIRIQNLIKYFSKKNTLPPQQVLKEDVNNLYNNLEYHLDANHLLENAFALYYAAHIYPREKRLIKKGVSLLKKELKEQLLKDGAHYERSYMYHNILLNKVLESISISQNNPYEWNKEILKILIETAEKMLGWSKLISFNGRVFPRFGDSIESQCPPYLSLEDFAKQLQINNSNQVNLKESRYRLFNTGKIQTIINLGIPSPKHQPAHSHADSFSFELYHDLQPIIVNPGISTYEFSTTRLSERGTRNHNTININGKNSSDIWSSFRVGKRAKITIEEDSPTYIKAKQNGYDDRNITIYRSWEMSKNSIVIKDWIKGNKNQIAEFNIHFHPKVLLTKKNYYEFQINEKLSITLENSKDIKLESYQYSVGFNDTISALKLKGYFKGEMRLIFNTI